MLVIWRGFGWLVPLIVLLVLIAVQAGVNGFYGVDDYYNNHEWPLYAAIGISAFLVGLLGLLFNYMLRKTFVDEETGKQKKSPSHSLFFVPMQYWAILIPVLFLAFENYSAQRDKEDIAYLENPVVNDLYLSDFSKIFESDDKKFRYGILKVVNIAGEGVEVVASNLVYDMKSGPRDAVRNHEVSEEDYFSKDIFSISRKYLVELKAGKAIYYVSRDGKW